MSHLPQRRLSRQSAMQLRRGDPMTPVNEQNTARIMVDSSIDREEEDDEDEELYAVVRTDREHRIDAVVRVLVEAE